MDNENTNGTRVEDEAKNKARNEYHPALCNALELELYDDRDRLEFRPSVKLNTLPREIDYLILCKERARQDL